MLRLRTSGLGLMLALMISGCGGDDVTPTATPTPGPQVETGEAAIDSMEVVVLESFPVQVHVLVRGNLPDGCTQLRTPSLRYNGADRFEIQLPTTRDPSAICTDALVPYEITVPLDVVALEAGTYTVQAGDQTAEFTLEVNNVMPGEAGFPECPVGDGVNQAFVNEEMGFCLLLPPGYQATAPGGGITEIRGAEGGPALTIDASELANGRSASEVADDFLDGYQIEYDRTDAALGGEPAVVVEGLPQGRILIGVNGDRVYMLTLTRGTGDPDGDALWQMATESFTFIRTPR